MSAERIVKGERLMVLSELFEVSDYRAIMRVSVDQAGRCRDVQLEDLLGDDGEALDQPVGRSFSIKDFAAMLNVVLEHHDLIDIAPKLEAALSDEAQRAFVRHALALQLEAANGVREAFGALRMRHDRQRQAEGAS